MASRIDYRLGGVPQHFIGDYDLMEIPDEAVKCVAFLGSGYAENFRAEGTVFFVTIPNAANHGHCDQYAVTARHVIEKIRDARIDRGVSVRVNFKGGRTRVRKTEINEWMAHPELSVDVAVCRWEPDLDEDIEYVPWRMAESQGNVKVRAGNDVYLPGLLLHYIGTERNEPIVRCGNIAMVPDGPVPVKHGRTEVFLIETRTVGGLSGSPVFFRIHREQQNEGYEDYLLGIISGYAMNETCRIETVRPGMGAVNSGLSIVMPAYRVREVISSGTPCTTEDHSAQRDSQN